MKKITVIFFATLFCSTIGLSIIAHEAVQQLVQLQTLSDNPSSMNSNVLRAKFEL